MHTLDGSSRKRIQPRPNRLLIQSAILSPIIPQYLSHHQSSRRLASRHEFPLRESLFGNDLETVYKHPGCIGFFSVATELADKRSIERVIRELYIINIRLKVFRRERKYLNDNTTRRTAQPLQRQDKVGRWLALYPILRYTRHNHRRKR